MHWCFARHPNSSVLSTAVFNTLLTRCRNALAALVVCSVFALMLVGDARMGYASCGDYLVPLNGDVLDHGSMGHGLMNGSSMDYATIPFGAPKAPCHGPSCGNSLPSDLQTGFAIVSTSSSPSLFALLESSSRFPEMRLVEWLRPHDHTKPSIACQDVLRPPRSL